MNKKKEIEELKKKVEILTKLVYDQERVVMETNYQRQFINIVYTYNGELKETLLTTLELYLLATVEKVYSQKEMSVFKLMIPGYKNREDTKIERYYLLNKATGTVTYIANPKEMGVEK